MVSKRTLRLVLSATLCTLLSCHDSTKGGDEILEQQEDPIAVVAPDARFVEWADVIEWDPDPDVATDMDYRKRVRATGLPWHVRDKSTLIELLLVPPGIYNRGAGFYRAGSTRLHALPVHRVRVSNPMYLGRYEVTKEQWRHLTKQAGSVELGTELFPATKISWSEAVACLSAVQMRLPYEFEWEYACRAGTKTRFSFGDEISYSQVNCVIFKFHPRTIYPPPGTEHVANVGTRPANPWGFYDMHGNVGEMCADWFGEYVHDFLSMEVCDPRGPITGEFKVTRGGSFVSPQVLCKSAERDQVDPDEGWYWMVGFRAARDP